MRRNTKNSAKPGVVILGSVALDDLKTPFGEANGCLGGSASYASLACSLFSRAGIVSIVGGDFPQKHLGLFRSKGIDTSGIAVDDSGRTFHWKGEYGLDLNTAITIRTDLNVLADFRPVLPEPYRDADFLFLGNIGPQQQLDVLAQMRKRPKLVVADTMNLWISSEREKVLEVAEKADIMLLNDAEARQLFRTSSIVKAAREILKLNSEFAVIKKGEHGCVMFTDDSYFACPGYPLENVKDPTGSGDAFGGSLVGCLANAGGLSASGLRKAIVYASCVASFNAEGFSVDLLRAIAIGDVRSRFAEFRRFAKF